MKYIEHNWLRKHIWKRSKVVNPRSIVNKEYFLKHIGKNRYSEIFEMFTGNLRPALFRKMSRQFLFIKHLNLLNVHKNWLLCPISDIALAILNLADIFCSWCKLNFAPLRDQFKTSLFWKDNCKETIFSLSMQIFWNN